MKTYSEYIQEIDMETYSVPKLGICPICQEEDRLAYEINGQMVCYICYIAQEATL